MTFLPFPNGKRFAFSIIDDTDVSTVENARPVYQLLMQLGMRTTKTVWPLPCPEGSKNFDRSQTLGEKGYLDFVLDLQREGFEITWHGATMESSGRSRTVAGLRRFRELLGHYPRIHASHALNRENLYWGTERLDQPILKFLYALIAKLPGDYYQGHIEESPYWWGDLCHCHIDYVRNLSFNEINLVNINPSMPYHDPTRPLAKWWFSASDAENAGRFQELVSDRNQEQLEREGGVSIIATHFGKGFVKDGYVVPEVRERLTKLSKRPGWFCPVSELLDWLRSQRQDHRLPKREWSRMQWHWAFDTILRKAKLSV